MKILLTGYKGFIGSNMLKALEAAGHTVVTYDWNDGTCPGVFDKDWVIHLGAISSTTERDVEKLLTQNLDFSCDLYDECRRFSVNMQYASSASIYGLGGNFKEDAPPDPRNPYSWSKYLFDRYVKQASSKNNVVQGFRYFNVYGTGEDHKGSQASPYTQFTKQAKETGVIKLFENSDKYFRDFIHVDKVIDIQMKFLDIRASGIFNVGTGIPKSFQDVANEVAESCNATIEYVKMPDILKSSYQEYTCADMDLVNSLIGLR
jgi:ADP-L-glycero-D-manno-heptose 6-epimerase